MNRFIAEKVMGLEGWYCPVCQRELVPKEVTYEEECTICGCHIVDPDYTTALDYFSLLQLAIKKEWWDKFIGYSMSEWLQTQKVGWHISAFTQWLLAPENLSRLIAEYHGFKNNSKTA